MNLSQLQFEGFLATEHLWLNSLNNLEQFVLPKQNTIVIDFYNDKNLRFGKWVERLVSFQLSQYDEIEILAENIQIQDDKITLGEIDCILSYNNQPIHLEIIFKYYLYDKSVGNTEIERWIGPNRRDSFIQKVDKLSKKQLPLLHHPKTEPYLKELKLSSKTIKQQVYFKAQLFVPLSDFGNEFPVINNSCIQGFYIYFNDLQMFNDCKFYIPNKHDWLIIPHTNVNWLSYNRYVDVLKTYIDQKNAPLCWLKKRNGELFKFFVVWW